MYIVRCETSKQLQTSNMKRGPLQAVSFTASQFIGIDRNCHRVELLTGVLNEFLSQWFVHRV